MIFTGNFEDLKERGFSLTFDGSNYFLRGLGKGKFLFINVNSRAIEVSDKKLLSYLKKEEVEE